MSNKKLNTSGILNELSGQSVFFQRKGSPTQDKENSQVSPDHLTDRVTERPPDRSVEVAKKPRRVTRRYSFEAYLDQIKLLKQISLQSAIEDDPKPISEMIRKAIDSYLEKVETNTPDQPPARAVERSEKRPT